MNKMMWWLAVLAQVCASSLKLLVAAIERIAMASVALSVDVLSANHLIGSGGSTLFRFLPILVPLALSSAVGGCGGAESDANAEATGKARQAITAVCDPALENC